MNTDTRDVIALAHAANNKRTREEAGLENIDNEEVPIQELENEQEGFLVNKVLGIDERRKRKIISSQIKDLKKKHPEVETNHTDVLDMELAALSTEQLEWRLDNIKIELGLMSPSESARSAVGLVGFVMEHYFGMVGIADKLINDGELISCIESYIPVSFLWLGVPLLTLVRVGNHISATRNGIEQNRGNQRPEQYFQQPAKPNGNVPTRGTQNTGGTVSTVQPN
jgi:hypothetical protein